MNLKRLSRRAFGKLALGTGLSVMIGGVELRFARRVVALDAPPIISTAEWNALPPRGVIRSLPRRAHGVVLHHTGKANVSNRSLEHALAAGRVIQEAHLGREWIDTGQHFTITRGGYILEGRHGSLDALRRGTLHIVGTHTPGLNESHLGVECEGTYSDELPPPAMYAQIVALNAYICQQYQFAPAQIGGHQTFSSTECPGRMLFAALPQLREDVAALLANGRSSEWPLLRAGDWSRRVFAAQYLLRHHGYTIIASGVFDAATETALRQMQRDFGLVASGELGATNWPKLVVGIQDNAANDAVRAIQALLPISVTGRFDATTRDAVRALQAANNLPASGVVDERTWQVALAG